MGYPTPVSRLIDALKKLPGVGSRTAERHAFHLLRAPEKEVLELSSAIEAITSAVLSCSLCHNMSEADPCPICCDDSRESQRLLVVEQPRDLVAFEDAGWRGRYHVLLGHVSPLEGLEARDLTLDALATRVAEQGVSEVVVATNPDYEGDATALHVSRVLAELDVAVTRIARGVASGSAIEYSNAAMLSDALAGRTNMDGPS
jgi:recombination protein RecR